MATKALRLIPHLPLGLHCPISHVRSTCGFLSVSLSLSNVTYSLPAQDPCTCYSLCLKFLPSPVSQLTSTFPFEFRSIIPSFT